MRTTFYILFDILSDFKFYVVFLLQERARYINNTPIDWLIATLKTDYCFMKRKFKQWWSIIPPTWLCNILMFIPETGRAH
jgi:hypothetical protein